MKHSRGILAAVVVALASLVTTAHAFSIHGTVKNGTTGSTNVATTIVAIQPSAGMEEVGETTAKNGQFVFENLPDDAPMFLLQTEYDGVTYNTQVIVTGKDQTIAVEVFDATTSWEGVKVIVPHLAASRRGNTLFIEQLYEITNETSPPKAVAARGGAFRMYLPAETDSVLDCSVIAGEVPVNRMPIPTGTKDVYSIDYPIRPGVTRVAVSYTIPYSSGSYTMKARYPLPVPHMMVFAVDSSMHVTSSTHDFVSQQSVHGMSAYALHGIGTDSELVLTFSGGNPNFAGVQVEGEDDGHQHAATPDNIRVAPSEDFKISIFMMVTVLLVLAGIVAMALRDAHDPLSDARILRGHYDLLVSRLARLDDLNAAQTIPSDAYRASREELVGRLAALAIQLRAHGGVHTSDRGANASPQTKAQ